MLEGGLFTVILAFSAITGHKNGDIGKRSCFKVSAPQNHETKILSSKFCGLAHQCLKSAIKVNKMF